MRARDAFLRLLACSPLVLAACVDVAYGDGAGGASASGTSTSGGASGVGGASVTGSATTTASGGVGGGSGGGGAARCVPTTEICNGLDDDCDGLTDQPPTLVAGNFCGCDWTFDPSMSGRAYALCPTAGQSFDNAPCPGGMVKAVFQTAAEQTFLTTFSDPFLGAGQYAFIGLRQAPSSPTHQAGWSWIGASSDPEGMVPQWAITNDYDPVEPAAIEDGDQDCAALGNDVAAAPNLQDTECATGGSHVLCEQASPQPCVGGGSCLLAEGCPGVFNCSLPAGDQCAPAPASETCNGKDDDCNGQVDASISHACGCVSYTNATTQREYKVCALDRAFAEAQCGPGFKLVVIGDAAEQTYVQSLLAGGDYLIGLYQLTSALALDAQWFWPNGMALGTSLWEALEPNDGDGVENDVRNCAHTMGAQWHDGPCGTPRPYVCEEI